MTSPQTYNYQGHEIFPMHGPASDYKEIMLDPRGIICMWEPPKPSSSYVMGIDPTMGLTNWHRLYRTADDLKVDNGAIEIIRIGAWGQPDVQVAEYAAPIDPEDLADVANLLGRMYGGINEENQCLCIIEVYPGPGLLTLRRMINTHGYTNHFVWKYLDTLTSSPTNSLGWTASPKAVRDLWIRSKRHISKNNIRILSPWLVEEMTDCEMDPVKMTGKAVYGKHDDRVRALFLALWGAHDWTMQADIPERQDEVKVGDAVEWQASPVSQAQMYREWEEKFQIVLEMGDTPGR